MGGFDMGAMDSTLSLASDYTKQARNNPLADRLIAHLPGPRWLWIAVWALLPLMHYVVFLQVLRISGHTEQTGFLRAPMTTRLASHAVQSYMIIISFWASRKLTVDIRTLGPIIARLSPACANDSSPPFAGTGSLAGPLGLTAVVTTIESAARAVIWGVGPAIIFSPYQGLWILPMMTLFWVYITLLIGLDRLGRQPMNLGSFPEDLSLGLGPVGAAVFGAFLIFCALTVPFLLVSLRDWLDLTIGLTFFGAGVGAFFLSVYRLHRQMVESKHIHVSRAGTLYAEICEPLRGQMTPAALQSSAPLLGAAETLMRRALAIQEWPFDDRTMTRIVAISTGVVTAIITRFVLSGIGSLRELQ